MDEVERLFREAERISPPASMWRAISAKARARVSAAPEAGRGPWAVRMAASLVLGLAALAALLLLTRDPRRAAPGGAPVAESPAAGGAEEAILDEDVLAWHADLGEGSAGAWDGEGWTGDVAALEASLDAPSMDE